MNAPGYERRTIPEMMSRGFWMMLGPMLLVPLTFKVIEYGNGWLTAFDFALLGTLAAMIVARGFEFYKGHPRTTDGAPATRDHLWRYALFVAVLGASLWVLANVIGNYLLRRD
jgi:hypothetical protein